MKIDLQFFGGRGGGSGKGGKSGGGSSSNSNSNKVRLGDEVTFAGQEHIVIKKDGNKLTLRPKKNFGGDEDFNGGGDKFNDRHIETWQLRK